MTIHIGGMNRQMIIAILGLILLAGGALWFSIGDSDGPVKQAVAAETEQEPQKNKQQAASGTARPWNVRCNDVPKADSEETTKYCQIVQRLNEQETGKRFAEFLIGYPEDAEGEARGIVILPLGVLLSAGVKMQIDEGRVYQFDYRYCTDIGCVSVVKLSDGIIDEMKKGAKASISFLSAKGQQVNLPITLEGFSKALSELPK